MLARVGIRVGDNRPTFYLDLRMIYEGDFTILDENSPSGERNE